MTTLIDKHGDKKSAAVVCDNCHTYLHMYWVGIEEATLSDHWSCNACSQGSIVQQERLRFGGHQEVPMLLDGMYAMQHAAVLHGDARSPERRHWAQSCYFVPPGAMGKSLEFQHSKIATGTMHVMVKGILEHWDQCFSEGVGESLSPEGSIRVILVLLTRSLPLLLTLQNQMAFPISLLSDNVGSSLNKLSFKAIEHAVEWDHRLMLLTIITKACLTDDTISVRKAAINLMGLSRDLPNSPNDIVVTLPPNNVVADLAMAPPYHETPELPLAEASGVQA